jgi:circadian clock protein KaiC
MMREHARISVGVAGLDDILGGGLPAHRLYLVHGTPGVGKTTLALQFLLEAVKNHEPALYITLSETRDEIREVAASHGWSLDGLNMYELSSLEETLRLDAPNHLYATSDVELEETMRVLLAEVERINPRRVVFDSLSEVRLLAQTPMRFRRQVLSLKQYFVGRGTTVLLLDDLTGGSGDLHSLAHGVISLDQRPAAYGADRRTLRVTKLRGTSYRTGNHDMVIHTGGIQVYPRLVAAEHRSAFGIEPMSTGIRELDQLLGGGLDRGGATLLMGPAGTGKSGIAMQLACAAASRGERVTMFLFEERKGTFHARATSLGMPIASYIEQGLIRLRQIDPAEVPPDQFTSLVRDGIEKDGAKLLVVDSVSGYFMAMPDQQALSLQLHELLAYTGDQGVASVLTLAQQGFIGNMRSPIDMSYLADTVLLLRYFESQGRVQKAVSVVKKRSGSHEDTIRRLSFDKGGIKVGPPLTELHGVLTGVPALVSYDQAKSPTMVVSDDA